MLQNLYFVQQVTSDTRRADAFDLRYSAYQLRNETRIKTEWDSYHNNNRLRSRLILIPKIINILMPNNRGINATYSATQIGIGTSMTSNCQMSHEKYGVCNKN